MSDIIDAIMRAAMPRPVDGETAGRMGSTAGGRDGDLEHRGLGAPRD